jgi:2-haloacid dehalogenase
VGTIAVFNVIGTLFSLDRLRSELGRLGARDAALELWFAQSLRDYFAFSHAGGYVPLKDVLEAALPRALSVVEIEITPARAAEVVEQMASLEPATGAAEACSTLRGAGWTLVALSNGSLENTTKLLEGAGLAEHFASIRSCDEVKTSKPARATYELALEAADGEAWMIAAHAWDLAGAKQAGLRTAWIRGVESEYLSAYPPPDIEAAGLPDAARKLTATVA